MSGALQQNGYPKRLIDEARPTPRVAQEEIKQPKAVVVLPYVRAVAEGVRRALKEVNIQTCFKPHSSLRQTLVRLKDRVPPEEK